MLMFMEKNQKQHNKFNYQGPPPCLYSQTNNSEVDMEMRPYSTYFSLDKFCFRIYMHNQYVDYENLSYTM